MAADKQTGPVTRTEQKTGPSVSVTESPTVRESAGGTKKSSKTERAKTKAERPKGRTPDVDVRLHLRARV